MTHEPPVTESETTELKKSLAELKQGLVSLTAMLNKHGQGDLWFGIAPNGRAVGLEINEKTLRDVSQAIAAHIEPASLYGNLSFDEIRQGNVSRRRNPKIAELLRRIHLVEAWGRGVSLILENAPDASFIEIGGLFITRFARPSALDATAETSLKPNTESPETTQETPETTQETPGTTQETLKTTQEILLQSLRQQPRMTTVALAQATGLSADGVKYHLTQLKRTGKLRRHGPTKGGYWEVITKADE